MALMILINAIILAWSALKASFYFVFKNKKLLIKVESSVRTTSNNIISSRMLNLTLTLSPLCIETNQMQIHLTPEALNII